MKAPRISVLIPVYNGERYIKSTVESVIRYSVNHSVEIIVVNDGSTDSTPQILENLKGSIKLITTNNRGESSAVNSGMEAASGDILLVVSADDPLFTERIFNNVVEFFDENPSAVALYSDWRIIDERGHVLRLKFPGEYSKQQLVGNFHCQPGPGTFFRRSSALNIGGRSHRWKFVGDYDFWLRLSREGAFGYRNEILAQWRSHDESTSVAQRGALMAQERISVIKDFVSDEYLCPRLRRSALSAAYVSAAQLSFFSGEVPGKLYLWCAFINARGWPKSARVKVVLFILLTPFSRQAMKFVGRLLSK
jgi:hypothetical protein